MGVEIKDIRELPDFNSHKFVALIHDARTGLHGWIAIHNDVLGPALGGTRMYPYPDDLTALVDVLRLSKAMTYKAALAGLKYGGGKAVLIGDPKTQKTEEYLRAYGRKINYLNGAFITAEDVGISVADIETIAKETPYVVGRSEGIHNGIKGSGDPSPITAIGIVYGIRAALEMVYGNDDISGKTFAIQGLGKVGFRLARLLYERGAKLIVSDVDSHMVERAVSEFRGVEVANPNEIHCQNVDVFSPCALGGILNSRTIPQLRCKIVAGAANNQLETPEDANRLLGRSILYAPDYVINAGGLINVADELEPGGYNRERALRKVSRIYNTLKRIFERSSKEGISPSEVADTMAEEILSSAEEFKRHIRFTIGI
jgi:leucine dehydrogenase